MGTTNSSGGEGVISLEDGTLGTLPSKLSEPSSSSLEQGSVLFGALVTEVGDERDDHLGREVGEDLGRHDGLGQGRGGEGSNRVGVNIVLFRCYVSRHGLDDKEID